MSDDGEMLTQQGDDDQVNAFPSMNPETDDATNRIQVLFLSSTYHISSFASS